MRSFFLLIVFCGILADCHKNKNANELVGQWKLVETFRIGQIDWDPVPTTQATILTFNNDHTYSSVPSPISSISACTGNYKITNKNTVMMTSSCQLNPAFEEEFGFTRSGNTLILDHRTTNSGLKSKHVLQ